MSKASEQTTPTFKSPGVALIISQISKQKNVYEQIIILKNRMKYKPVKILITFKKLSMCQLIFSWLSAVHLRINPGPHFKNDLSTFFQ